MSTADIARPFGTAQSVNQEANDALRKIEVRLVVLKAHRILCPVHHLLAFK